jgi:hypothetical protein
MPASFATPDQLLEVGGRHCLTARSKTPTIFLMLDPWRTFYGIPSYALLPLALVVFTTVSRTLLGDPMPAVVQSTPARLATTALGMFASACLASTSRVASNIRNLGVPPLIVLILLLIVGYLACEALHLWVKKKISDEAIVEAGQTWRYHLSGLIGLAISGGMLAEVLYFAFPAGQVIP